MFFLFLIGLFIGSFLNCVIYRLENNLPISITWSKNRGVKCWEFSRSFCPHCQNPLQWFELIPIISFVIQKFRCRSCHRKISWQYPITEIMTGVLFLLIFNFQFPISNEFSRLGLFEILNLIYLLTVTSLLILIAVFDYKYYIIPNKFIYPLILLATGYQLLITPHSSLLTTIISSLGFATFFFLMTVISGGRWMGMGDAKLVLFMGLFLGWPKIFLAIFLSFVLGSLISLILIFTKQKTLKSQIPFGPFLILGTFIALFWSQYFMGLI
ncbi:MAG: prepilin peptidase [Candidatus Staskawiczbacteria bacterium]|nr:prepilin peptidase [Candidatus Staskawiczbacteria bacterium]